MVRLLFYWNCDPTWCNSSCVQINCLGGKGTVGTVVAVCVKAFICDVIEGLEATTWFRVVLTMATTWARDSELRGSQLTCTRKVAYSGLTLVTSLNLYWLTDDCSVGWRRWRMAWLTVTMLSAADIIGRVMWYIYILSSIQENYEILSPCKASQFHRNYPGKKWHEWN